MKVLFSTEEARELPEAIGRVRAQLSGGLTEFEEAIESLQQQDIARGRSPDDFRTEGPLETALEILRDLDNTLGDFDLHQAEEALAARGLDASKVVAALLRKGLIYESERGVYKPV